MAPRLGCVADTHLGNFNAFGGLVAPDGLNERGRLTVETLGRALNLAESLGCVRTYVAGDLFHSRRPEPAIVAGAQRVLRNVTVIPGNHDAVDASTAGGNTACEMVHPVATVPRVPTWETLPGVSVLTIPFTSEVPMHQHLREIFEGPHEGWPDGPRVLVTHIGVTDGSTAPWLKGKPDAVDAEELLGWLGGSGFAGAFVGNYHQGQTWVERGEGIWVCQVGTLCPAGHGDDGVFPTVGGLATWSPGEATPTLHEVSGPRFLTLEPGDSLKYPRQEKNRVFVRARVAPDGAKADLTGAAGVIEVPQVTTSELGPVPDREIESAEEAIVQWSAANGVTPETAELALTYYKKGA